MEFSELTAISPLDGRYHPQTKDLRKFFSEYALIRQRVKVEVEYFIALTLIPLPQLKSYDKKNNTPLRNLYMSFCMADATRIKEIEKTTNHDVKAVEYFLREKFEVLGLSQFKEFIHFGLTSQDINNTATPGLIKKAMAEQYYPLLEQLIAQLDQMFAAWETIPMLARTHGQPASPTLLGKEVKVFIERLVKQTGSLKNIPYSAKFGGATGNFNAHLVAYPHVNWPEFGDLFVNSILALDRSQTTTQIEHYDNLAALFDNLKRINTILIDLARDFWQYISMDYFKQSIKKDEVGSSAMPHKVNPIDFENAEGNLGMANAIFEHLSAKLPISRLQRDLTDSTVLRNIGVPISHTILAMKSLLKGLNKLIINEEKIKQDLEDNWIVVSEAIQTILRRENYPNAYDVLKKLTRTNEKFGQEAFSRFISELEISETVKQEMRAISPFTYTGVKPK